MIKRYSIFIAATIIILFNLFHTGCTKQETVPAKFKSIDSTWHKIENALNTDTLGYKAVTAYLFYCRNITTDEDQYLEKKIKQHSHWNKNEDLKSALYLYKGWRYIEKQQDSVALTFLTEVTSEQIDIQLSAIQARAFYHYLNNELDTALKLYIQSYQIAKSQDNQPWILRCANNVGTLYFDLREFDIASTYFTEALVTAQALKTEVPMLINNIITCALVDSEGKEAIQLYKKYSNLFKPKNTYEKSIYDINRIHYFWKTQQIDSFKYHLDKIDVGTVGEVVETMRDQQYLFYYVYQNDKNAFNKLFDSYKSRILKDPIEYLLPWSDLLNFAQTQKFNTLSYAELFDLYNRFQNNPNKKLKSTLSNLLYLHKSGTKEGSDWLIQHLRTELEISNSSAKSFQNDLKNQIKIHDLHNENKEIKLKLEVEGAENRAYLTLFIGSILVLILLVGWFILYQKNKQITIQKLRLEIQNSRNISEINLNKKQFAERLISANQAVNKRLEKISNKLKSSEFAKNPEIVQARKEIDAINVLKGEWSLEMQQIQTIDDISFLLDHFKCIQNFNQTEQSLLAYLLNGHKVKEIAALMSLSEQHVRNTKTKVLKALSTEKKIEVTLEFLAEIKTKGNNLL